MNAGTTDFARGIAIDPVAAHLRVPRRSACPDDEPDVDARHDGVRAHARRASSSRAAARVAHRRQRRRRDETPNGTYDADTRTFTRHVPAAAGPVGACNLAPVVDHAGNYALRVFVVCFDSNQIIDYDPDNNLIEAVHQVGLGPFALAFDPFDFADVASNKHVDVRPARPRPRPSSTTASPTSASFTQSYVQVIDLDNSTPDKSTWATVVYTRGHAHAAEGKLMKHRFSLALGGRGR